MHIYTAGRHTAEAYEGTSDTAVISIRGPGNPSADLAPGWYAVFRAEIADNDDILAPELLASLVEFLYRMRHEGKDLLVHCEMGVSRSVGVAYAIAAAFGLQYAHRHSGNAQLKTQVLHALQTTQDPYAQAQ